MRHNKNIILNLQNIISHFTGSAKIITLSLVIITLSFANIINIFALSYQTETDIKFTFNPTLSIDISPADLIIDNLTPGTTDNSNVINVSVATNSAYGYILTTSVGNNTTYSTTNLAHTNGSSIFSSISTNANLTSLEDVSDNNIWGYSYKLSDDNTWSNYSGLPLYSSPLKVLLNTDSNTGPGPNSLDFKIAAKASTAQPSGAYSNIINFSAVTKPTPTTLAEAYANYYQATNKTMHNGYYVMQDIADSHICENTEVIGSELQVIDIRDDKVYWIAKLADGHCWMTQNLDLNLVSNTTAENYVALTSENTDLNDATGSAYQNGYSVTDGIITWIPAASATTINFSGTLVSDWKNSNNKPYSASKTDDHNTGHASLGNHYNWTAVIASNESSKVPGANISTPSNNPQNSICPKGWRLPTISNQPETTLNSTNEFSRLNLLYNNDSATDYTKLISSPLYFVLGSYIIDTELHNLGDSSFYWSSTVGGANTYALAFYNGTVNPARLYGASSGKFGFTVRCLAR